jgi:hypothetical protein
MGYHKNKRDRNHSEIAEYLVRHGCEVLHAMQPLDLLVNRQGTVAWCEIKMPGSQACYTRKQLEYISGTRFNVVIATDSAEALMSLREKRWISQMQKDALAAMLMFTDKAKFTPAEVAQAIHKR